MTNAIRTCFQKLAISNIHGRASTVLTNFRPITFLSLGIARPSINLTSRGHNKNTHEDVHVSVGVLIILRCGLCLSERFINIQYFSIIQKLIMPEPQYSHWLILFFGRGAACTVK